MKPRYPVAKLQAKFEKWLHVLYGRKSMQYHSKFLDQFFNHFPDNSSLEEFGPPDIYEYEKYRLSHGGVYGTVLQEIKAVRRFYNWAIEDQELPLSNPVKLFKGRPSEKIVRRKKDTLRLEEYKRVLEAIVKDDPQLMNWLWYTTMGYKSKDCGLSGWVASAKLRKIAKKIGMSYLTMQYLRRSLRNGLWREIIRDWTQSYYVSLNIQPPLEAKKGNLESILTLDCNLNKALPESYPFCENGLNG